MSTYVALYSLSQAALALGDDATARRHVEEGIALSEQTRDISNLAYFLETLAVIESAGRRPPPRRRAPRRGCRAARDVGTSVYGYYLPDETLRASAEQSARAALGDAAYEDTADAGRALELPDVVRLGLDEELLARGVSA